MTILIVIGACLAGGALIALIAVVGSRSSRSADRYRAPGRGPWYGSPYNNLGGGGNGSTNHGNTSWNDSSGPWHSNSCGSGHQHNCSSSSSCSSSGSCSSGSSCGSGCGGGGGD